MSTVTRYNVQREMLEMAYMLIDGS